MCTAATECDSDRIQSWLNLRDSCATARWDCCCHLKDKIGRESPSVRVAISISSARTGSKVQGLVCLSDKFDFTHVYLTKRQGMVYVGETKFHFFGGFGINQTPQRGGRVLPWTKRYGRCEDARGPTAGGVSCAVLSPVEELF